MDLGVVAWLDVGSVSQRPLMQGGNADGDPVRHREAAAIDPCGWALVFVVALWALGHYVRLAAADRPAGAAICALVRAYGRLSWCAPATFWPP